MLKQIGKLTVNVNADYNNSLVKALERDGFTTIKETETYSEAYYIVAIPCGEVETKVIGGSDK